MVTRQGYRDWLIQRFSAVWLVLGLAGFCVFLFLHPDLTYPDWRNFFDDLLVKVITLLFFASLMLHAWIGMWTVLTDYVKCGYLRMLLQGIIAFFLAGSFLAALLILWSI